MMSYDKASPNAKIGCSNSNDPEFLEQLVREGKTNREIALILDLDYGSVASILYRYGIKRDPNRPCKRCGGPIGSTNTRQLYCKECQKAMDSIRARYEAREIWHDGWIGRGYAALITVDGHRLETLPQIKTFFGFRRDSL